MSCFYLWMIISLQKHQISARNAPDPGLQPARQIQDLEQNSAVHVVPLQDVALQVGFK